MERYYLCDVVEVPFEGDLVERRPVIRDHTVNMSYHVHATENKCIALVNTPDHSALLADTRLDPLPLVMLDDKVSAIATAAKNKLGAALAKRGFATNVNGNFDGYRDLVRAIGREISPTFDENNTRVSG